MCIQMDNQKLYDDWMQPLEWENEDKTMWNDKCDYYNVDKCSNLNPENLNLVILQLNIHSILAHQTELKALLHTLEQKKLTCGCSVAEWNISQ